MTKKIIFDGICLLILLTLCSVSGCVSKSIVNGTWQNTEDSTNYVEFYREKKVMYRREISYPLTEWMLRSKYTILNTYKGSTGKYIESEGMYWEILSLNQDTLSLIYTIRGNILKYHRIHDLD